MYKEFKVTRRIRIAFNIFPKTAKRVSKVYHTGIQFWETFDDRNYSIVLFNFRILLSFKNNFGEQNFDNPHPLGRN